MSVRAFTRDGFLREAKRQGYPVGPNGVPAIDNRLADLHAAQDAASRPAPRQSPKGHSSVGGTLHGWERVFGARRGKR